MFLLRLFGGASLEGASGPLTGRAVQRRRLALLAILALEHPRPIARDKLIAWLWPEHDTERARHLLRDSLYLLRHALGEDSLLSTGDELRLNPQRLRCDLWEFEEALAQEGPEAAVRAYAGPLLDGVHLGGASELEHWLDGERERLARAHAGALEQLAEQATARGDAKAAVGWWRHLAAADPYNSRVTLRLMQALEAAGERAGALQQARIHAALLEQEFQAEPDPAVAALAERLRREPLVVAARADAARALGPQHGAAGEPEPQAIPASEPPGAEDPPSLSPSSPATAPAPRRRITGKSLALSTAAIFGLAAVLLVGRLLPVTSAPPDAATETAAASPKSIAVLPCANLSRDPEQEYFSDGLTEEVISALSQVRVLRVVARTSVFAFKGENRDIREIARALNVGTVLECSVRAEADRVRVTAQLINAADGFHLWSETYDREGMEIFAIQSDLALRIASALEAELTPGERQRLAHRATENLEAYTLYLKGRYFWNQRTREGLARAIEYFERAIEADPQYAPAYAGLASAYGPLGVYGYVTPREAGRRTREAALKAVELDDGLGEAHAILAAYLHLYEWDWPAAEREYRRAIELEPGYPTAHMWYSYFLDCFGRVEESIREAREAVELDPLAPIANAHLGRSLSLGGRPDLAEGHLRNALELDSTFWIGHLYYGETYETLEDLERAVRAYRTAAAYAGPAPDAKARLARLLVRTGNEHEARGILEELQAQAAQTRVYSPIVATVLWALGDRNAAFAWLEAAVRQRHPAFPHAVAEPAFAPLRDDPRYLELLRRAGLPS